MGRGFHKHHRQGAVCCLYLSADLEALYPPQSYFVVCLLCEHLYVRDEVDRYDLFAQTMLLRLSSSVDRIDVVTSMSKELLNDFEDLDMSDKQTRMEVIDRIKRLNEILPEGAKNKALTQVALKAKEYKLS